MPKEPLTKAGARTALEQLDRISRDDPACTGGWSPITMSLLSCCSKPADRNGTSLPRLLLPRD